MAIRKANLTVIWGSGTPVAHAWVDFDLVLVKVFWQAIGVFMSSEQNGS